MAAFVRRKGLFLRRTLFLAEKARSDAAEPATFVQHRGVASDRALAADVGHDFLKLVDRKAGLRRRALGSVDIHWMEFRQRADRRLYMLGREADLGREVGQVGIVAAELVQKTVENAHG